MFPQIQLSPEITVPTYYLILSITVCISLWWVNRRAHIYNLSPKLTLDLSLIIMVAGFVGARAFHIFYEDFAYYQQDPSRIFEVWNGGFVFYGGALTAAVAAIGYVNLKSKDHSEQYMDLFAPVLSFSYMLGRWACLFAGCCYGRYCDLPWAINGRHPTQIYAALWELGVLFILLGVEKIPQSSRRPAVLKAHGSIFLLWVLLHAIGRLLMEAFRDDYRGPTFGLSISSWISIFLIALSLSFLLRKTPKSAK